MTNTREDKYLVVACSLVLPEVLLEQVKVIL